MNADLKWFIMFVNKFQRNVGHLFGKEINDTEKMWTKYAQAKYYLAENR